jgi:hypothetical protein
MVSHQISGVNKMNKTQLTTAVALALGATSFGAQANLTTSAVLEFSPGGASTVSCLLGTAPPCTNPLFNVTDITGSFFSMDSDGSGSVQISEKVPVSMLNGIHIGTVQGASGSHVGAPTNMFPESPNIDNPWNFFSNTGMSQTTSPITEVAPGQLDFSGWGVTWAGIGNIPMGGDTANFGGDTGIATITCSTASCSQSSTFVLDYAAHVPLGDPSMFGGVPYALHLEGHVGGSVSSVPVPAAAWLMGSGLLGLVGVARRRKA